MRWIGEDRYEAVMKEEILPKLESCRETGFDERIPGQKIYYEHFSPERAKGVIVLSHGFTESIKKFYESVWYMLQEGYEVWGVDHRGHGRSWRANDNPYVVHAEHFHDYILDFVHFTDHLVKPAAGSLPLTLYGHSMGGCIAAWTIEEYPDLFRKAVLTSPMLGLSFAPIPTPVMFAGATILGIGERKKQPLQSVTSFRTEPDFANSCDSSECRYLYYFQQCREDEALQTTSPSIGWGLEAVKACAKVTSKKETAKIRIPVLLCQAGNDTMVKNASQDLFASRVPTCEIFRVPGMKHELYMTDSPTLRPYWEKIFSFLSEVE
ncbi:MAG: alpha/beta hydrolase [Oscillospiraceae bacterium]|nr:alpha/beta hydrolase [Oscillospiraceae bacterium]